MRDSSRPYIISYHAFAVSFSLLPSVYLCVFCRSNLKFVDFLVCSGFDFWYVSIIVSAMLRVPCERCVCGRVSNGAAFLFMYQLILFLKQFDRADKSHKKMVRNSMR